MITINNCNLSGKKTWLAKSAVILLSAALLAKFFSYGWREISRNKFRQLLLSDMSGTEEIEKYLHNKNFPAMAIKLLDDKNDKVKKMTLVILAKMPGDYGRKHKILNKIIRLIDSNHWEVSFFAVEVAEKWKDRSALPVLLKVWEKETHPSVRIRIAAAVASLAEKEEQSAIEKKIKYFQDRNQSTDTFFATILLFKITHNRQYVTEARKIFAASHENERNIMIGFLQYTRMHTLIEKIQ